MNFEEILDAAPVVPLIQAEAPDVAVKIARALSEGGLHLLEVVLRSEVAMDCMGAVATELPNATVGAGTVLSADQARSAIDAGARFIVSPGLDEGVVRVAREGNVPVFPGIYTPGELQRAVNLGVDVVKFFPAHIAGGVPAVKALAGVFPNVRFMPTGGVSAANLGDYLAVDAVIACGGSWLTPKDAVAEGKFTKITELASEALTISRIARHSGREAPGR